LAQETTRNLAASISSFNLMGILGHEMKFKKGDLVRHRDWHHFWVGIVLVLDLYKERRLEAPTMAPEGMMKVYWLQLQDKKTLQTIHVAEELYPYSEGYRVY